MFVPNNTWSLGNMLVNTQANNVQYLQQGTLNTYTGATALYR